MLTVSSSSLTPVIRGPAFHRRRRSSSSDLFRPRTIIVEKSSASTSYGFSIQTYGFASLNIFPTDESATSFASLSTETTTSRKSSTSISFGSSSQRPPIQLVTYIDHVQDRSPAWEAGLRSGSVILSINDKTVENDDHETLVQRIMQSSSLKLKLVVIQQNINKQIELCEKLQKLQRQLHEKEEELEELSRQEGMTEESKSIKETDSPLPELQHFNLNPPQRQSSFCHDKIPLDWRQSVTDFAYQRNSINRKLNFPSTKYVKNRYLNPPQRYQRSMSLSTIVSDCSKPPDRPEHHHHPRQSLLKNVQVSKHRRAHSYEELFSSNKNNVNVTNYVPDESMVESGCSLAMDLSRSLDRKISESLSLTTSSSSSTATINTDETENTTKEKTDNKHKQFKWKLRISK